MDKNHLVILIEAEMALEWNSTSSPSWWKVLYKLSIEGMYLHIITVTYNKPTDEIILNGEKLKDLYQRNGTR
jgi:hypothetical protein